jgi:hypothetical protein
MTKTNEIIQETYLPYTKNQVEKYFLTEKNRRENIGKETSQDFKHVKYYIKSAEKYKKWNTNPSVKNLTNLKAACQVQKDEKFWTLQTFLSIFEQSEEELKNDLLKILVKGFGKNPPLKDFKSWNQALSSPEDLVLIIEANVPSPIEYKEYLSQDLKSRQFIPYVLEAAEEKNGESYRKNLEKHTNVDAMIINVENGFNIFFEAKVLSDMSYMVSYDDSRNQIARNIDVMLTEHSFSENDIRGKMNPEKSLFVLLVPEKFKGIDKTSRLYNYKMKDYKKNPETLCQDLNHRDKDKDIDWHSISKRIGWLSWEDFNQVNNKCCPWVKS